MTSYVFLINYCQNMLSLWNPTENPMTLICHFNSIKGQMLQGKLKGHIWLTIYMSYKLWSYEAPFMRFKVKYHEINWRPYMIYYIYVFQVKFDMMLHLEDTRPWFDLERLSNVKCLEVNWWFIDDFIYVFLINYVQNVLSLWNIASWKPNYLDLPLHFHQRSNVKG